MESQGFWNKSKPPAPTSEVLSTPLTTRLPPRARQAPSPAKLAAMPPTGAVTPSACISAWLAPACHSGHVSCPPHALLKKLDTFSSDLLYCINSILVITCITWYFLACLSVSAQEKEGPGLWDTWTRPQRRPVQTA